MVQVLPYVPSFLERMAPQIKDTASGLVQGYQKYKNKKQDETILEQLKNKDVADIDYPTLWSKLSPEAREIREPFLKSALNINESGAKERSKSEAKSIADTKEKDLERQELKQVFDTLKNDIEYTGSIFGAKSLIGRIPGTEAFEKRKQFDALGFLAADKVFTHFNKGTVSKDKLAVIRDDLSPKANLTERENKARIKALETIMGLPPETSESKLDAVVKKEKAKLKKQHPSMKESEVQSSESDDQLDNLLFG